MQLTFWGVRGSLPSPEPWAWRYGGNTPCLEIQTEDQLFILDAGTGIRDLGHDLIANRRQVGLVANILLTHYHWDHIQGLPFFEPLYHANSTLHFFGPPLPEAQAPGTLGGVPVMGLLGIAATIFLFSTAVVRQSWRGFKKLSIKRFIGKK